MVSNSLASVGNNVPSALGKQYVKSSSGLPNNSLQQMTLMTTAEIKPFMDDKTIIKPKN